MSKHTRQLCSRNVSQDEQLASCLMDIYISLKCINDEYILKFADPRYSLSFVVFKISDIHDTKDCVSNFKLLSISHGLKRLFQSGLKIFGTIVKQLLLEVWK